MTVKPNPVPKSLEEGNTRWPKAPPPPPPPLPIEQR